MNAYLRLTDFRKKVYAVTRKIPRGKITTYGEIAKKLNTSARAVGQALRYNIREITKVPCHRVVMSNGSVGGYSGSKQSQINRKILLLKKEGIKIANGRVDKQIFSQRKISLN